MRNRHDTVYRVSPTNPSPRGQALWRVRPPGANTSGPARILQPDRAHQVSCYAWNPGRASWGQLTPPVTLTGAGIANVFVGSAQPDVTISFLDDYSSAPTHTLTRFVAP